MSSLQSIYVLKPGSNVEDLSKKKKELPRYQITLRSGPSGLITFWTATMHMFVCVLCFFFKYPDFGQNIFYFYCLQFPNKLFTFSHCISIFQDYWIKEDYRLISVCFWKARVHLTNWILLSKAINLTLQGDKHKRFFYERSWKSNYFFILYIWSM